MPASSKQQQKFMGMVHALQKGDMKPSDASAELKKVAKDMKPSDVKDFASISHKGLPKTVKQEIVKRLKEYAMMNPNHQTKVGAPADSLRTNDEMDVDINENFPTNWLVGRVSDQHTKLGTTPREDYDDTNFEKDDSGQEDLEEAYTKGNIFGGKLKINGVSVPLEVELIGADNKKNVFITKVVHIDSKYHSKLPSNGILEIPARIFRAPGGGWYKVKNKSAFEGITNEELSYNEREMVTGIIDILNQVKDTKNRKEIALNMIKQFKEENIDFDYSKFLSQLKEYGSNLTDTFLLPRHSDKLTGTPEEKNAIDNPDTEDGKLHEVADGDWHFKAISKLYKKAGSFGRKKIAAVVTANPNSTWDKIAKELKYSDYEEVTEYTDRLGLTEVVENLIKKHKK